MKIKVWAVSDVHGQWDRLIVPKGIDLCICAGDMTNAKDKQINSNELLGYFDWCRKQPFDIIFVPGNHDTSMEGSWWMQNAILPANVSVLRHEFINYKGLEIFGSPYTPSFGSNWAFNVRRDRISKYWDSIPYGLDILVTHGPAKGILDYTEYKRDTIVQVGDRNLLKHIKEKKPTYHIFGHLHNENDIINSGTFRASVIPHTTFINASCVTLRHKKTSDGTIFDINTPTIWQRSQRYLRRKLSSISETITLFSTIF